MEDSELEKLFAEGQATSNAAALRAVFEAGRKSVADEAAVAAEAAKPAAPVVKTRKAAKPAVKAKKKK